MPPERCEIGGLALPDMAAFADWISRASKPRVVQAADGAEAGTLQEALAGDGRLPHEEGHIGFPADDDSGEQSRPRSFAFCLLAPDQAACESHGEGIPRSSVEGEGGVGRVGGWAGAWGSLTVPIFQAR